jgi:hypothetical protein
MISSVQTDEARHAQQGAPTLEILMKHDPVRAQWMWTRCSGCRLRYLRFSPVRRWTITRRSIIGSPPRCRAQGGSYSQLRFRGGAGRIRLRPTGLYPAPPSPLIGQRHRRAASMLEGAQALGLEPVSADVRTSLYSREGIPPGKGLARPETGRAFLATPADPERQRPSYPGSLAAKLRKLKDLAPLRIRPTN